MANEELLNEEEISLLSLTDEEGNEVEFELIDSVDYEGAEYLILLPPEEEAAEVVILEVEPHKDGTESYLSVDDEATLNAVFAIFKERFQDFFAGGDQGFGNACFVLGGFGFVAAFCIGRFCRIVAFIAVGAAAGNSHAKR